MNQTPMANRKIQDRKRVTINSEEQEKLINQILPPHPEFLELGFDGKLTLVTFSDDETFTGLTFDVHKVYQYKKGHWVAQAIPHVEVESRRWKVWQKKEGG